MSRERVAEKDHFTTLVERMAKVVVEEVVKAVPSLSHRGAVIRAQQTLARCNKMIAWMVSKPKWAIELLVSVKEVWLKVGYGDAMEKMAIYRESHPYNLMQYLLILAKSND
ncbi:hypothetical protein Tco_0295493 [Tanacetum coccineum]